MNLAKGKEEWEALWPLQSLGPCSLPLPQQANDVMSQSTVKFDLKLLSSPCSILQAGRSFQDAKGTILVLSSA